MMAEQSHGRKQQLWPEEKEAESSHLEPKPQSRQRNWQQARFLNYTLSHVLPLPLKVHPSCVTNWGPSVHMLETMADSANLSRHTLLPVSS